MISRNEKINSGATFDRSGRYRYNLWREWNREAAKVLFVMLNPSRADAEVNDQTIGTCMRMAMHKGFGSMEVVNLFAFRTKDPSALLKAPRPVGKDNDRHILEACARTDAAIVAWGNHGSFLERDAEVLSVLNQRVPDSLLCLGITRAGQPRHPLYVKTETQLLRFSDGKLQMHNATRRNDQSLYPGRIFKVQLLGMGP